MEIFKKNGKIYLTTLKFEELLTILKIQINCDLIFSGIKTKTVDEVLTISLEKRTIVNKSQGIEYSFSKSQNATLLKTSYDLLLNKISILTKNNNLSVVIDQNDFRKQEGLIKLIPHISQSIVNDCVFIELNDGVYTIKYKPFANGDSNVLHFFENNTTLLAFTEDGPTLITENVNMNNITDIICD